jgi:hypothetical protein
MINSNDNNTISLQQNNDIPQDLIDSLSDECAAVSQTSRKVTPWLLWGLSFPLLAAIILLPQGLRYDIITAYESGTLFWKVGSLLLVSLILMISTLKLSSVTHNGSRGLKAALIAALIFTAITFVTQITNYSNIDGLSTSQFFYYPIAVSQSAIPCLLSILGGGAAMMVMLWAFWLRHEAPFFPSKLGMICGLCCGLAASSIYGIHCAHDNIMYILSYYGTSIVTLGLLGRYIGKFLQW